MDAESEMVLNLLIKEAEVDKLKPVEECANIRQWLDLSHIIHDDAQIDAATEGKERYPFTLISISMPVVSDDRDHAQMMIGQVYGALAGGRYTIRLKRRENNRWRIENRTGTSVN